MQTIGLQEVIHSEVDHRKPLLSQIEGTREWGGGLRSSYNGLCIDGDLPGSYFGPCIVTAVRDSDHEASLHRATPHPLAIM